MSPNLTADEIAWMTSYRAALAKRFAGVVERLILFGSKARGEGRTDSDIDLLVIVRMGDRAVRKAVRRLGHELAIGTSVVPSIMVYTSSDWEARRANDSPIYRAVDRDGVPVH